MRRERKSIRNAVVIGLTAALCGGALGACASAPAQTPVSGGGPGWIDRPNGTYDDEDGRAIHAVGIANDNPNIALRRRQASDRARDELARTLKVHVQGLVQDYMSTNRDFYDMDGASSVEYYEAISNQVTDQTLSGSMQVDAWKDNATGAEYVLFRLDFNNVFAAYQAEMEKTFQRETQRKRIKAQKDDFEDKLDQQLQRLRQADLDEIRAITGA